MAGDNHYHQHAAHRGVRRMASSDPAQRMLWNNKLYMDENFRTLKDHALPVDIRAMRACANSAKQIDIVLWLVSRLTAWSGSHRSAGSASRISSAAISPAGTEVPAVLRRGHQGYPGDLSKPPPEPFRKGITLYPTDAKVLLVPQRKVTHKAS